MARDAIPTWFFALTVIRRGEEFLLVQEAKPGNPWYLPAGRVELGESLADAAVRETLEESGVAVELEGLLRLEHTPRVGSARVRAVFVGRPVDDTPPKTTANEHSLRAGWFHPDDLDRMTLRGPDVAFYLKMVRDGATLLPLGQLGWEE